MYLIWNKKINKTRIGRRELVFCKNTSSQQTKQDIILPNYLNSLMEKIYHLFLSIQPNYNQNILNTLLAFSVVPLAGWMLKIHLPGFWQRVPECPDWLPA